MQLISVSLHDLQSRWLPARQTGSSTRKKVLLRIMIRDTTVCEDDLVKQALIYFVDECHRQATRCPVDPELDPSSCGNARAAPSTGSGRERGCHGTGRTLAFPSKKKNKLWIWLAFDRSASSTGNVAIVMPPR